MSETPESVQPEETAADAQPELLQAETAFVVMLTKDGSWRVTSDVTTPFAIERVASRADVRIGTTEINHLVSHQDLAALVLASLKATEQNS